MQKVTISTMRAKMTAANCSALLYEILYNPCRYDLHNCTVVNSLRLDFFQAFSSLDVNLHYSELDGNTVLEFLARHARTNFESVVAGSHQYYGSIWFIIFCTFLQTKASGIALNNTAPEFLESLIIGNYAPVIDLVLATAKGGLMQLKPSDVATLYADMAAINNAAAAQLKSFVLEQVVQNQRLAQALKEALPNGPAALTITDYLIYNIAQHDKDFSAKLMIGLWDRYYRGDALPEITGVVDKLLHLPSALTLWPQDKPLTTLKNTIALLYNVIPNAKTLWRSYIIQKDNVEALRDFLENVKGTEQECQAWLGSISLDTEVAAALLTPDTILKMSGNIPAYIMIEHHAASSKDLSILSYWLHFWHDDYLSILKHTHSDLIRTELLQSSKYGSIMAQHKLALLNLPYLSAQQCEEIYKLAHVDNILAEYTALKAYNDGAIDILLRFTGKALQEALIDYEKGWGNLGEVIQLQILANEDLSVLVRQNMLITCYKAMHHQQLQTPLTLKQLALCPFAPQSPEFYNLSVKEMLQPNLVLPQITGETILTYPQVAKDFATLLWEEKILELVTNHMVSRLHLLLPGIPLDHNLYMDIASNLIKHANMLSGETTVQLMLSLDYSPTLIQDTLNSMSIELSAEELAKVLNMTLAKHMDAHTFAFLHTIDALSLDIQDYQAESLLLNYVADRHFSLEVTNALVKSLNIEVDYELIQEIWQLQPDIIPYIMHYQLEQVYAKYDPSSVEEYVSNLLASAFSDGAINEDAHIPLLDNYFRQMQYYGNLKQAWSKAFLQLISSGDHNIAEKLELVGNNYGALLDFTLIFDAVEARPQLIRHDVYKILYEAFAPSFIPALAEYTSKLSDNENAVLWQSLRTVLQEEMSYVKSIFNHPSYASELYHLLYSIKLLPAQQQVATLLFSDGQHSMLFELTHSNEIALNLCNQLDLIDPSVIQAAIDSLPVTDCIYEPEEIVQNISSISYDPALQSEALEAVYFHC